MRSITGELLLPEGQVRVGDQGERDGRVLLPVFPETGAVQARVDVRVHEAGREKLPRPVDHTRAIGGGRSARPHGSDAGALHHNGGIRQWLAPVPVDDRSHTIAVVS